MFVLFPRHFSLIKIHFKVISKYADSGKQFSNDFFIHTFFSLFSPKNNIFRLAKDQSGYNFDFRILYKVLPRDAAFVRFGGVVNEGKKMMEIVKYITDDSYKFHARIALYAATSHCGVHFREEL